MLERTNRLGAIVTVAIFADYILMLLFRLFGKPEYGHWLASIQFLAVFPLVYLLLKAPHLERPVLYYFQISLMLLFLFVELLLDYVLKIEFRQVSWMTIGYVVLFFTATGGMLGIAAHAGRKWTFSTAMLFWIMAVLAFVGRAVTGL